MLVFYTLDLHCFFRVLIHAKLRCFSIWRRYSTNLSHKPAYWYCFWILGYKIINYFCLSKVLLNSSGHKFFVKNWALLHYLVSNKKTLLVWIRLLWVIVVNLRNLAPILQRMFTKFWWRLPLTFIHSIFPSSNSRLKFTICWKLLVLYRDSHRLVSILSHWTWLVIYTINASFLA